MFRLLSRIAAEIPQRPQCWLYTCANSPLALDLDLARTPLCIKGTAVAIELTVFAPEPEFQKPPL